ncbi:MAG: DNA-binding response regulator [Syntrophus sp. (in: bacteria)]|nr:DNA-binding response regulator [Syntrophus sp. (in: bacteria)]
MKKPKVLLADDHRIVAEGLRSLLETDFDFVGVVEDGRELIAAVEKFQPDVAVVDISMPKLNGIDAVRHIKQKNKQIKIVFLTMHPDVTYAISAFEAGASAYVLKHSAPSELVAAINEALAGRTYVTPRIAGDLMQAYRDGVGTGEKLEEITPRQREVLQLLAEGHSIKQIAGILKISTRTVEFHKYRMMEDLAIKTVAELIRYAVKQGIVTS